MIKNNHTQDFFVEVVRARDLDSTLTLEDVWESIQNGSMEYEAFGLSREVAKSTATLAFKYKLPGSMPGSSSTMWEGQWDASKVPYPANRIVRDDGQPYISNTETSDKPAPQGLGDMKWLYSGVDSTDTINTTGLITGQRYTVPLGQAYNVSQFRVYTILGNNYEVYRADNVNSVPVLTRLLEFEATTTGWVETGLSSILQGGTIIDYFIRVVEPDPTPQLTTLNYNYIKPNNPEVPAVGQMTHSSKELGIINIHKSDTSGDQSTFLNTLQIGDTLERGIKWSIQSITDNGSWLSLGVAPATQDANSGIADVVIQTITSTPITFLEEVDYYQGAVSIQGIRSDNGSYANISLNQDAYGFDLHLETLVDSPDWDALLTTPSPSGNIIEPLSGNSTSIVYGGGNTQNTVTDNNITWTRAAIDTLVSPSGFEGDWTFDPSSALVTYQGNGSRAVEVTVSGSVTTDSTGNTDHTFVRVTEGGSEMTGTHKRYAGGRATGSITSDVGFTTVGFGLFSPGDYIELELAKDFIGTLVLESVMIAIKPI